MWFIVSFIIYELYLYQKKINEQKRRRRTKTNEEEQARMEEEQKQWKKNKNEGKCVKNRFVFILLQYEIPVGSIDAEQIITTLVNLVIAILITSSQHFFC